MKDEKEGWVIPTNEYKSDLEDKVAHHLQTLPVLPKNEKRPTRSRQPDSSDPIEQNIWCREELRRIKEGHFGMSGKMYFWYNYVKISDKEFGTIRPEFRMCQAYWFDEILKAQNSREWGLIGVKRRQIGASWLEASDVLHDAITKPGIEIGMTSKTETDSKSLFAKVKFIYDNLPQWLRPTTSAGNTQMKLDFSYRIKDEKGNWISAGTRSKISVKAPVDTAWEGSGLYKLVLDEVGKYPIKQLYNYSEPALMKGTRRVGTPVIFGTAGDITKEGADFRNMYFNADAYKLNQFFFAGYMGLHGLVDDCGNDMTEEGVRWIVYERFRRQNLAPKEYNDFIQQYPLTVQEAFTSNETYGVGNSMKINKQINALMANPPVMKRGHFMLDTNKKPVFVPTFNGHSIIYEEPDPSMQDLYFSGCLLPGEMVMTGNGLKPVETVTYQDKLINEYGEQVGINKIMCRNTDESAYTIKLANTYRTTTLTKEHPLLISPPNKKKRHNRLPSGKYREEIYYDFDFNFTKTDSVKIGDFVKVPNIYKTVKEDFYGLWDDTGIRTDNKINNPIYSPEFWWFLGLWLGDGWVDNRGYKVYVCFGKNETNNVQRLREFSKSILGRAFSVRDRGATFECCVSNNQLNLFLTKHFGKYAGGKIIPEWVKYAPIPLKTKLLSGYLDSDGCVGNRQNGRFGIDFVSINLAMLEGVQDILFSLGIVSSLKQLRTSGQHVLNGVLRPAKQCFQLDIAHHHSCAFKELLNDSRNLKLRKIDLTLPKRRKLSKQGCFLSPDTNYIFFRINAIDTHIYSGPVYNFDCETHTYMCHHLTTHNCDTSDHDAENPNSKDVSGQCLFIMKKRNGVDPPKIVFEYYDKPRSVRDFWDQALIALLYYGGAKVMIERNKPGMINYFDENGFKHLMATKPNGYTSVMATTTWNIGYHRGPQSKRYGEELVTLYIDDYCEWVPSVNLLKECLVYDQQNTDRVASFCAALILMKEDKWEATSRTKKDNLFKTKLIRTPDGGVRRVNN